MGNKGLISERVVHGGLGVFGGKITKRLTEAAHLLSNIHLQQLGQRSPDISHFSKSLLTAELSFMISLMCSFVRGC